MCEFFSIYHGNDRFPVFSPLHIAILVTIGVIIFSMIIFRKKLRLKSDLYRTVLIMISLIIECSYLFWVIAVGRWHLKTSLPLELCEITLILCIIMLVGKSYRLFEVAYFWGLIGSTLALLFPNLHVTYHHFAFWAFMLTHALNLFSLVFMISIEKYQPTGKSIGISFMVTNIYMLLMLAINHFLGSHYYFYYLFSKPAPNISNPLMFTNSWVFRIFTLEGITLIALLIGYLPFIIFGQERVKKQTKYQPTEV